MFRGQKAPEVTALNYGYALLSDNGIFLEKYKDDFQVYSYQLYDYALSIVGGVKSLQGKDLVEVGCGRGGCFRYVIDEYKPKTATGIDLSDQNIAFCRHSFEKQKPQALTSVNFIVADSQRIPDDLVHMKSSADVVINIESSHCYPQIEAFFEGVKFILKEDGIFIFSDFRPTEEMEDLRDQINSHFEVVKEEDIRRNVFQSLVQTNQMKI